MCVHRCIYRYRYAHKSVYTHIYDAYQRVSDPGSVVYCAGKDMYTYMNKDYAW